MYYDPEPNTIMFRSIYMTINVFWLVDPILIETFCFVFLSFFSTSHKNFTINLHILCTRFNYREFKYCVDGSIPFQGGRRMWGRYGSKGTISLMWLLFLNLVIVFHEILKHFLVISIYKLIFKNFHLFSTGFQKNLT